MVYPLSENFNNPIVLKKYKVAVLLTNSQREFVGKSDSVAAGVGTSAASVAVLPKFPKGICW